METSEELSSRNQPQRTNRTEGNVKKDGITLPTRVTPVFGFRSRTSAGKVVYLKFCTCDSIPCPRLLSDFELAQIISSPEPEKYRVPIHVGDRSKFTDKSGRNGDLYCVTFNRTFYEKRLMTSELYHQFFVCLAVQEVENKHNITIDRSKLRQLRSVAELGEESVLIPENRSFVEEISSSTSVKINPTLGLRLPSPHYEIKRIVDNNEEHLSALFCLNGVTDIEEIQLMTSQRRLRLIVPKHYHMDIMLPLRCGIQLLRDSCYARLVDKMQLFKKSYSVKRRLTMGQKDMKEFVTKLANLFPSVSEQVEEIFVEPVAVITILTHSRCSVDLFVANKVPMFFAYEDLIYPTVYFLWKFPKAIVCASTTVQAGSRITEGSDLMIPGVMNIREIGTFEKGVACSIRTENNAYPFAVGQMLMSSAQLSSSSHGVCVRVLHVSYDFLWKSGPRTVAPSATQLEDITLPQYEQEEDENSNDEAETQDIDPMKYQSNDYDCNVKFLTQALGALKGLSSSELPMFANVFYGSVLLRSFPKEEIIDVKKTKYKKFSTFLEDLQNMGIVETVTEKGVLKISNINKRHEQFKLLQSCSPISAHPQNDGNDQTGEAESASGNEWKLTQKYSPKADLLRLIKATDLHAKKNMVVSMSDFRSYVTDYVSMAGLKRGKVVCLDDTLLSCLPKGKDVKEKYPLGSTIDWATLFQILSQQLLPVYDVSCGESFVERRHGSIPKIQIRKAFRRGGKVVTLVDNLEAHQIKPADFAHVLRPMLASSATLNSGLTGVTGAQVQIQGDHVAKVQQLLQKQYNVKKHFIAT
ncbi:PIH1 and SUI1 and PUA domain containing protein [Trichuris trichiura]|uniref:PIH1 and SUI1 and PUA domain containing protein n=1 Tax=Trichuris trichiura TaxID=36087 RepID=A0A077Z5X2_TRITR|nr:PIH1 and SUI1 and PUA domain containing protein [Trichuris trichiura]